MSLLFAQSRRPTDYIGGAGLTDVADDVGVVVASQMVGTEGDSYLKSLCGKRFSAFRLD